jgi:histidine phosphotransferase ChpT
MKTSGLDDALRLAELLANRLCHDLSGPLNGLGAGLAEAVAGSAMAADGLALAQEAATVAIRRLVLLRAAWGEVGEALDRPALERLASGLPGRRVRVDLSRLTEPVRFAPNASRLLLNVMLLAAESLPRGGTAHCLA